MYLDLCLFILTYLFHKNEVLMCNLNCKVFNVYIIFLTTLYEILDYTLRDGDISLIGILLIKVKIMRN